MKENLSEKELLGQWGSSDSEKTNQKEFIDDALISQLVKISMFDEKVKNRKLLRLNVVLKVAVVVLCMIQISTAFYELNSKKRGGVKEIVYVKSVSVATGVGQLKTIVLSDGTQVTLNAMSSIVYPEIFHGDNREVVLVGEAFFDVAKNPDAPFIVKTDMMEVEALGTSFEVSAYKYRNDVSATLSSGLIRVSPVGSKSEGVIVDPNQRAVISEGSNSVDVTNVVAKNVISWKDGVLIFEESPLDEVFESISKRFGIEIFCRNQKYNSVKINATILKEMNADETMKALSEIVHFKYYKNKLQYIIR